MNTSKEASQRPDKLGDKVAPQRKAPSYAPDAEGHTWRHYKPGFEVNEKNQLRTCPRG